MAEGIRSGDDTPDSGASEWEENAAGMRRRALPEENGMCVSEIEFKPGKFIALSFSKGYRLVITEGSLSFQSQPSRVDGVLSAGQEMTCTDSTSALMINNFKQPVKARLYYPKPVVKWGEIDGLSGD